MLPWQAVLLIFFLIAPALLVAQGLEATLVDVKGEVQWAAAGSTQWQRAGAATVISASDRVRTAANSAARLAYYEGSTTDLAAGTEIQLLALRQEDGQNVVRLAQASGATQAHVQDVGATATSYEVETASAEVSAAPSTCPWVAVGTAGRTRVRNYPADPRPAGSIPPELFQSTILVPGPAAPVPVPVPVLVPRPAPPPLPAPPQPAADAQPGSPCPPLMAPSPRAGEAVPGASGAGASSAPLAEPPPPIGPAPASQPPAAVQPAGRNTATAGAVQAPTPETLPSGDDVPSSVLPLETGALRLLGLQPPLLGAFQPLGAAAIESQQTLAEQATLETRRPQVQWSAAPAADWQTPAAAQTVRTGDRVRTGQGAAARLVYFEGSATEIGAETGVVVQRLERTAGGNIVTSLFQSVGTTISRVGQLVDPAAGFQVETPAAVALVRGTTPRVDVAANGVTRVSNIPDGTRGLVEVVGRDPAATRVILLPGQFTEIAPGAPPSQPSAIPGLGGRVVTVRSIVGGRVQTVTLAPGEETEVVPGLPPLQPAPIGQLGLGGDPATAQQPQVEQQQRQQQRQLQQQQFQQQALQAQLQAAAFQAELQRLERQELLLEQQITRLISATATPSPHAGVPCAVAVGQICTATITPLAGSSVSGSGTGVVTGSQRWTVTLIGLPPGASAAVVFQTTAGTETIPCAAGSAGTSTVCQGTTTGNVLLGSSIQVVVNQTAVAQGIVSGGGPATPATATRTAVPVLTTTATPTGTVTPVPVLTTTATPTGTVTPVPVLTTTATPAGTVSPVPVTPGPTATGTVGPTVTGTPILLSTPTATATGTPALPPTPTATATSTPALPPTPTASPTPITNPCAPNGAVCHADLTAGGAGSSFVGAIVPGGTCADPNNCALFTSTGAGFSYSITVSYSPAPPIGGTVTGQISTADANNVFLGTEPFTCSFASLSSRCTANGMAAGRFPQFNGSVTGNRN